MRNLLRYGNKAALLVGILLLFLDTYPLAHDYGAWPIGALFCFWYSATAVWEDTRIKRKIKIGLLAYLAIMLVLVVSFGRPGDTPSAKLDWSVHPALKSMEVFKK